MSPANDLQVLLEEILSQGDLFLSGVQNSSAEPTNFLQAIVLWGQSCGRHLREFVAILEPCIRQSIVMALLPRRVFEPTFSGSIDTAIDEHLAVLRITLPPEQKRIIRDVCINIRAVRDLDGQLYRRQVCGISDIRARPPLLHGLITRQNNRCLWCGAPFDGLPVVMTLEHVAPKHIGGDHYSGKNWALACRSCNEGKSHVFAWPASATAHDYLSRKEFCHPNSIGLPQRWAVLMRCRECEFCRSTAGTAELKIYLRIETGLPIPANCSVACEPCLGTQGLHSLSVRWAADERERA